MEQFNSFARFQFPYFQNIYENDQGVSPDMTGRKCYETELNKIVAMIMGDNWSEDTWDRDVLSIELRRGVHVNRMCWACERRLRTDNNANSRNTGCNCGKKYRLRFTMKNAFDQVFYVNLTKTIKSPNENEFEVEIKHIPSE